MSPARAPSSSSPPKASVYAFCTQESSAEGSAKLLLIFGNPVMTIETSIRIIR
jgi:hypothetical protein